MKLQHIIRSRGIEITAKLLQGCLSEHQQRVSRFDMLENYYLGNHQILRRDTLPHTPNNRLAHPFPRYITNTTTGYMFGNPIQYQPREEIGDISALTDMLDVMDTASHDAEVGKDLSIFGTAYELLYIPDYDGEANVRIALLDPRTAFVVYDDDVACNPMFGVYYVKTKDAGGADSGYMITAVTAASRFVYRAENLADEPTLVTQVVNVFGVLPMVQYVNNEDGRGDYEDVLSLIDAYNVLESDRVNDKERFVNALLVIKNATLGDEPEEIERMLKGGIIELPGEGSHAADAGYLTKMLNETETEVLKRAIAMDIHKFSHTPDFSDEQFSGNASGVAMRFKVLSLEYLAKVKERFFVFGLRERLHILSAVSSLMAKPAFDPQSIKIVFNRTLPNNELEIAQTVATLSGIVSTETLLTQLPFVMDVEAEAEKLRAENAERTENQVNMLSNKMRMEMG